MVRTPFATLPANIGICSQRYLELLNHYMFSNQKLRALALIINAAPFVISFNYHKLLSHNVYNDFLVSTLS